MTITLDEELPRMDLPPFEDNVRISGISLIALGILGNAISIALMVAGVVCGPCLVTVGVTGSLFSIAAIVSGLSLLLSPHRLPLEEPSNVRIEEVEAENFPFLDWISEEEPANAIEDIVIDLDDDDEVDEPAPILAPSQSVELPNEEDFDDALTCERMTHPVLLPPYQAKTRIDRKTLEDPRFCRRKYENGQLLIQNPFNTVYYPEDMYLPDIELQGLIEMHG